LSRPAGPGVRQVLSLHRTGFKQLLDEAGVGDTIRIADAARLFRSVGDVLALRPVLTRRGLRLRVESGLLSGIDLAGDDSGTKMIVQVLAAVLEFERDLISENTKDGVATAASTGKTLGRPAALEEDQVANIVKAYREEGAAVKALARQYGVDPKVIRRALDSAGAREVPDDLGVLLDDDADDHQEQAPADPTVLVDVPGLVAEHPQNTATAEIREVLREGRAIRRGPGHSVRVTAPLSVHLTMIEQSADLMDSPAGRKAHRIHSDRVAAAQITD
jgi:putative DNA-invertase from lambdoid prophage Rac